MRVDSGQLTVDSTDASVLQTILCQLSTDNCLLKCPHLLFLSVALGVNGLHFIRRRRVRSPDWAPRFAATIKGCSSF